MTPGEEIRLKLVLHYDGTRFFGWQVQKETRTVQGELHAAVERLTREYRPVVGAGRTDRGVHATGQVAAVKLPGRWSAGEFRRAMNAVLPDDIWVREVRRVNLDFHPRFDAVARRYRYRLGLAEEARSPFHRPWCWPMEEVVDRSLLEASAELLEGTRSFRAFAKSGQPQRGYRCTIHRARWTRWDDLGLSFTITADRYLHHMVRYLVGTMRDIALGRRPLKELSALLDDPETELITSPPAPPEGLFLERVEYPEEKEAEPSSIPEPRSAAER